MANMQRKKSSEKAIASTRQWQKNNPERVKEIQAKHRASESYINKYLNRHLKRTYGITYDDYLELFNFQNGKCKICDGVGEESKGERRSHITLAVDHCHKTGKIRGLLCRKCNMGLGHFNDSSELLTSALSYIREFDFA